MKCNMINLESLDYLANYCEGMDINSFWHYFDIGLDYGKGMHNYTTFTERREAFLWTVKQLVEHGYIRLVEMGKPKNFLSGTVDENLENLRKAFPKDDEGIQGGLWFFFDDCPLGCNWYTEWGGTPVPFLGNQSP